MDRAGAQRVALTNQRVAERYFPGENPVGKQIDYGTQPKKDGRMTIVGVVGNVRDAGFTARASTSCTVPGRVAA